MKNLLVVIVAFILFTLLGLFLANPHGFFGGYVSLIGMAMILPFILYGKFFGHILGLVDWVWCFVFQFIYFSLIIYAGSFFAKQVFRFFPIGNKKNR